MSESLLPEGESRVSVVADILQHHGGFANTSGTHNADQTPLPVHLVVQISVKRGGGQFQ